MEEHFNLLSELDSLVTSLQPEKIYEKLAVLGIDRDRITKLIEYINNEVFHFTVRIDVYLFLLKYILPDDFDRLVVREHMSSSPEAYEFDPVKNGHNIIKHGLSFSEVISYSKHFGTLMVRCPNENDGERIIIFSDLSESSRKTELNFPLAKVEEQAESYVISIVQSRGDKFRFISSRVMSRKRHKKSLRTALKNIYPNDPDTQNAFIDRCLEILNRHLFTPHRSHPP